MLRLHAVLRTTVIALAAVLLALAHQAPASAAAEIPGTYAYWKFEGVTGLSEVTYPITVEQHPGQQSQIYWSNQVDWANGHGGYAGMQTNGRADTNLFLFSVWDVTEAKAGSSGSWCQRFDHEGEGVSCRIWHRFTAGQTYRFQFKHEGSGWWGMTVTNASTGTSFKVGSIRVGADSMKATSVNWTEYYRWNDSRASCLSEPYSRALFGTPSGNNGAVKAKLTGSQANGCTGFPNNGATVTDTGTGARQTLAIGNSVMAPITGPGGKCADVASGAVVLYGCHGGGNQAWVVSNDGTIRSKDFQCLDAAGDGKVGVYSCHGGDNQQWRAKDGTLVNSAAGKCLDTEASGTSDNTRLVVRTCAGTTTQQWTAPVRRTS